MEIHGKPLCKFGSACYRKNPKHLEIYSHAEESEDFDLQAATCAKRNNTTPTVKRKPCVKFIYRKKESCDIEKILDPKRKRENLSLEKVQMRKNNNENTKTYFFKNRDGSDTFGSNEERSGDCESIQSSSWFFIKNESSETISSCLVDLKNKTSYELIKMLFLVDMPPDFYSFYKFCKTVDENHHLKTFRLGELKLVGPFDILSGEINYAVDQKLFLCHWRFYYDPPEFQTVLAAESGFHIGYWRDDPKEDPVFLASNNPNKNFFFKIEAENIFGTVYHYLEEFVKNCDPCIKGKMTKLQMTLGDWAEKNKFSLQKKSRKISSRQKKVSSKTFHGAGIVVPVDAETELGYRPLIESDENLKKICKLIIEASDESERDSVWENLQPLITAANIANDECDFGNGLELGINLFCMGSSVFHDTIEHLLSTAYLLLNRIEFEEIIRTHLKFRRKGNDLSSRAHVLPSSYMVTENAYEIREGIQQDKFIRSVDITGQRGTLICSASIRLYSQEMRIIKNVDTAHLRRGTGGRSSFNGNVVTVFGATGFLGRAIVNQLGKRGAQLIIPYRCDKGDFRVRNLKLAGDLGQVLFQPFNIRDSLSIRKAIKYSNIVINLIGKDYETRNFSFYDVNVKGAKEIAAACKEMNVERLIHFSALNVSEKSERYYLKKLNFLPTKLMGEKAVLSEFPTATIFRPSSVYGSFDRFLWPLCAVNRAFMGSIPLYARGEKTIKQPVFVGDVAKGVISAINNYDSRGKIFQIVGPEKFYLKDIAIFCAQTLQRRNYQLIHDIKYDIYFPIKALINGYILDFLTGEPSRNILFEYIERESVSDKVDLCLPSLLDLGVPLSKFEDKVPGLIFKHFMHSPAKSRHLSDMIMPMSISEKAVKDYYC